MKLKNLNRYLVNDWHYYIVLKKQENQTVTFSMYSKYIRYSGRTSSWSKMNHSLDLGLHSGTLCVLEERCFSK